MVGRWQSGAPLALSPDDDDPALGSDPHRNNDFRYGDDPRGFKCPVGAHARRANPRDAFDHDGSVDVRLHRMIRRGTSYGPMLPEGVLEDDGADRGHHLRLRRGAPEAPVRVRQDPVAQRRHLHRRPAREGPARRPERRLRDLHRSRAPDPPPAAGPAAVRRHPRRRVLLRSGPARDALAGGARHHDHRRSRRRTAWRRARQAPTAGTHSTSARRRPTSTSPSRPVLLDYVSDGRVAVVTLNRPHADNAITTEMGARLTEVVETIAVRTAVRVVILTGAGERAFSVGSDLRQRKNMTKEDWLRQRQDFDRTLYTVRQLRKPDLRRRQRDRLRRRVRAGPEHRLHHRLGERHLRPARGDARPRRRRRLTGPAAPPAAPRQGAADADDRRPDHRRRRHTGSAWSTSSTRQAS